MIMKAKNNPLKLFKYLAQPLLFNRVNPTRREVESKGNLNAITSQKLSFGHLGIIKEIFIPISFLLRIGLRV